MTPHRGGGRARRSTGPPAAVLWDMDGTLIDTEPYWMASEADIVHAHGGTWTEEDGTSLVGSDLIDGARYIAEHGGVDLPPEEIVELLLDGVIARLELGIPWRPGARELLAELGEAGIPCALVTMSWRRFVDPVLLELPPDTFAAVITGDEVDHGKPHPEPYLRAAEVLGVDPDRCVAIEDSPTGVRSAVAAGCRVLGVPNVRDIDPQPGVTIVPSLAEVDVERLQTVRTRADATRRRRSRTVIGALALVAVLAAVIGFALERGDGDTTPPPLVPLDVWAPYWTLTDTVAEFSTRIGSIREVSPFWYRATGATEISTDPNASAALTEEFLRLARRSDALIVPSVVDAMPAGGMAGVLADPVTRQQHVDALVEFVIDGDFDGVDLDYEQFAFADARSTWHTTRPNWVRFVTDLADALHAEGRTLTVSIPPIYSDGRTNSAGYWVYDHGAIAEVVDHIRIMAYDFSTSSPGSIAPLDFVQRTIDGVLAVTDDPSPFVLGIPVYGYNWPASASGTCPASAEGRVSVTARSVHDLLERRGGTPVRDDEAGEWSFTYELEVDDGTESCTQFRQVHYVDGDGALERIELAREAGFGGVALWALGYEDDPVWAMIDGAIRRPGEPADPDGVEPAAAGG